VWWGLVQLPVRAFRNCRDLCRFFKVHPGWRQRKRKRPLEVLSGLKRRSWTTTRMPCFSFSSLHHSEGAPPAQASVPKGLSLPAGPLAHSKPPPDGPHPPLNPQLGPPAGPSQGERPQEGPEPTQQARRRTAARGVRGLWGDAPP
jgi:hypothetical protein